MNYFFVILFVCHVNLLFASPSDANTEHGETKVNENIMESNEVPSTTDVDQKKPPTVLIVTLFRNKAHIMPFFFTYLNRLEYPKDRISLW